MLRDEITSIIRQAYGARATLRPGQLEAIEAVVARRERRLLVQHTGWGKSTVYFTATRLLRERGKGPTIIVSPLLALINQTDSAALLGVRAATLNSTNKDVWSQVLDRLECDDPDALLISPERLGSQHFNEQVLPRLQGGIGLLVVDEAHCISDWGHDFRPDYRRLIRIVKQLPATVPVLATTATANQRVIDDIAAQLGDDLHVQRGTLMRESLRLQCIQLRDQSERLAWLADNVPNLPGTGIIYCLTVADCERVSAWLKLHGIDAPAYHGETPPDIQLELENKFLNNNCKALVATIKLGMGYDKPDVGFVVHFQRPGSVVAYYQQIGRAGRSLNEAPAILLNGSEDDDIQDYFIRTAFPTRDHVLEVMAILEQHGPLSIRQILQFTNLRYSQVDNILKLTHIDGAVGRDGSKFFRTPNPVSFDTASQQRVTTERRRELARMQDYVKHTGCLMEFIARELDDETATACGQCANCKGDVVPRIVNHSRVLEAIKFLQRDHCQRRPEFPQNRRSKIPHLAPA